MKKEIQYEIYIGCKDKQIKEEVISVKELREMVAEYFKKKKIDYSVQDIEGGYQNFEGFFIYENTMCVTIIGNQNLDIIKFAKSLSMYMNQECFMVTKSDLEIDFR